jgi:hypothetical protein
VDRGESLLISLQTSPASDSWGFVGVVSMGDYEAYRTIRAYPSPGEALEGAQHLLTDVLGSLMAGQEWRSAHEEFGHAPRRTELEFGLRAPSRVSLDGTGPHRHDDEGDPRPP